MDTSGDTKVTIHRFDPPADSHEAVRAAGGRVEVLRLVTEAIRVHDGVYPLYRVRNVDNGREAFAYGDELTTNME